MTTIEDIILSITHLGLLYKTNSYDKKVLESFAYQVGESKAFTEKQANLAVKLLTKYKNNFSKTLQIDLDQLLENPRFKLPFRQISQEKRIDIVPHEKFYYAIRLIFPYDEQLVKSLKENRSEGNHGYYEKAEKCWFFPLTEQNLWFFHDFHNCFGFSFDETFLNYDKDIRQIYNNLENHYPLLSYQNKKPKLQNISKFCPQINTDNLEIALFEARKLGIFSWTNGIETDIDQLPLTNLAKSFLKTSPHEKMEVDAKTTEFSDLGDIIKFLTPCCIILSQKDLLARFNLCLELLKAIGIKSEEISVLFRLANENNEIFNTYVRNNFFNNPVENGKTRVVFLLDKLPKPVLKSEIKFHSTLVFDDQQRHNLLNRYINCQENVIKLYEHPKQKALDFGFLLNNN